MFDKIKGGKVEHIQGLDCNVPPVGWVYNYDDGKLLKIGVFKNSENPIKQKFTRTLAPLEKKFTAERNRQESDPGYFDDDLEIFRRKEWDRRLYGYWFYNNGKPTFITGLHYFYLNYWEIDIGYPNYRDVDRKWFYFVSYCDQDPNCGGILDIEKRRGGKSYRGGCYLYEGISRESKKLGAIQSKTREDARALFAEKIIEPFQSVPDFFVPEYDKAGGKRPKTELRFFATNKKGTNEEGDKDDLASLITFRDSSEKAYDGRKIRKGLIDEYGKCFSSGTKIRMYDGGERNVEDITIGDVVMGDDSTKRKVLSLTSGANEMFKIIPNKGDGFVCNGNHTLVLKWATSNKIYGNKLNDIIKISVYDYLKIPKTIKKNYVLIYSGYELNDRRISLDPYMLGLWLGDGNMHAPCISNVDTEVCDYIEEYCKENKLKVKKDKQLVTNYISSTCRPYNNVFWNEIKKYGLVKNKRIPIDFLRNSKNNRLLLLAGLIDSDGYAIKSTAGISGYEITQKRKDLSEDIVELARGCGFYVSVTEKVASMKRNDGSYFYSTVYRIAMYGDCSMIPCKIERKRCGEREHGKNRRNPLTSGFKIESVGVDNYYGFSVDGNSLFLLANGIVAHNCEDINIEERHRVLKYCILQDGQIIGKLMYTTTVEDMGRGNARRNVKKLWDESDVNKRNDNGRTTSLLYRYFIEAYESEFFDEYGMSLKDKAVTYFNNIFKDFEKKGDHRSLASEKRKNPFTIEDVFRSDGDTCLFNAIEISNRLSELAWKEESTLYDVGNFLWENGIGSKVVWNQNPNGRFKVRYFLHNKEWDESNNVKSYGDLRIPKNTNSFVIGCDPYDHDFSTGTPSDAAFYVMKKYDPSDPEFSNSLIVEYCARPTPKEFYEDVIKAGVYYGCMILFENQKYGLKHYMEDHGYGRFLMHFNNSLNPGIASSQSSKQLGAETAEIYFSENMDKIFFPGLLEDALEFTITETTKYDRFMAFMWTLIASKYMLGKVNNNGVVIDIHSIYKQYRING